MRYLMNAAVIAFGTVLLIAAVVGIAMLEHFGLSLTHLASGRRVIAIGEDTLRVRVMIGFDIVR